MNNNQNNRVSNALFLENTLDNFIKKWITVHMSCFLSHSLVQTQKRLTFYQIAIEAESPYHANKKVTTTVAAMQAE